MDTACEDIREAVVGDVVAERVISIEGHVDVGEEKEF